MDKIKALKLIKKLDDELTQLDPPGDILLKLENLKKEIEKEDVEELSKKQEIETIIKQAVDDEHEFYKKYKCFTFWSKHLIVERMKQNEKQNIEDLLKRLSEFIEIKSISDEFGYKYIDPTDLETFIEQERENLEEK